MFGIHRNFPAGGGDTSDATAEQWQILNGLTAYIASGKVTGSGYFPALLEFDGSTGYLTGTFTSAGYKVTVLLRFNRASFSGGGAEYALRIRDSGGTERAAIIFYSSDHATTAYRSKVACVTKNSSNTNICRLISSSVMCDGANHYLMYSFDGDAGTGRLYIDGSDEDDTGNAQRVAPTTGTLGTGASSEIQVGAGSTVPALPFAGQLGCVGYQEAYLTNTTDFMQSDGSPKNIESTLSTVFGATPKFWNPHGDLRDNRGSAGNLTQAGTVVVGDAGA